MKILCPLEDAAARYPDGVAIRQGATVIRYAQWRDLAGSLARRFRENGIGHGARVAILASNRWEYLLVLTALWRTGAIACLLNIRDPQKILQQQLKKLNCRGIIEERPSRLTCPRGVFRTTFSRLLKTSLSAPAETARIDLDQNATIIFTSGTSGEGKAVLHTFGNHYFNARGSNINIPFKPGDRWLLTLPLYHVSGLSILFRSLLGRGTVVLPGADLSLISRIRQHKITHVSLVATQLHQLLKARSRRALATLKVILLGGSAIPSGLVREAVRRDLPVHISYGLTEMASQAATSGPLNVPTPSAHRVRVLPFRELKISRAGEILVRGRTRFKGYWRATHVHKPFDRQGWFATGDLGCFVRRDDLRVLGRKDLLFQSGGENIYPEEIEKALLNIPGVVNAVVLAVADRRFGQRPVTFLKTVKTKKLSTKRIQRTLAQSLPRFKIPDVFYAWPEKSAGKGIKIDRKSFAALLNVPKALRKLA